jgi:hypothetical protein
MQINAEPWKLQLGRLCRTRQIRLRTTDEVLKGEGPCVVITKPRGVSIRHPSLPWPRLEQGWAAFSVDGSFDDEGKAGVGMTLRNSSGEVIFSSCLCLSHCNEVLEAELCAIIPLIWRGVHPH